MKHLTTPILLLLSLLLSATMPASAQEQPAMPTRCIAQTFTIATPNYKVSPYTGLDRQGWIAAAE